MNRVVGLLPADLQPGNDNRPLIRQGTILQHRILWIWNSGKCGPDQIIEQVLMNPVKNRLRPPDPNRLLAKAKDIIGQKCQIDHMIKMGMGQ